MIKDLFKLGIFGIASLIVAATSVSAQSYSGDGSSGIVLSGGGDLISSGSATIVTSSQNPDFGPSGSGRSLLDYCARVVVDSTTPWEGQDCGMLYGIGYVHFSDISLVLPDILKQSNCALIFLKDVNPVTDPCGILDPTAIRGVAISITF